VPCGGGWFGYTGGLPGYNSAAWHFPAGRVTVVVFVTDQASEPPPGVANAVLRDMTRIMTPGHSPFAEEGAGRGTGL
jgi:hypothetical protein